MSFRAGRLDWAGQLLAGVRVGAAAGAVEAAEVAVVCWEGNSSSPLTPPSPGGRGGTFLGKKARASIEKSSDLDGPGDDRHRS